MVKKQCAGIGVVLFLIGIIVIATSSDKYECKRRHPEQRLVRGDLNQAHANEASKIISALCSSKNVEDKCTSVSCEHQYPDCSSFNRVTDRYKRCMVQQKSYNFCENGEKTPCVYRQISSSDTGIAVGFIVLVIGLLCGWYSWSQMP